MKKFSKFDIPFTGLSLGSYSYNFKIDKAFFDLFEYCEIDDGEFDVAVELVKQSSMLILNFELSGNVTTDCDRCGSLVTIPVHYSTRVYIKFGDEPSTDESIVVLPENAHKINIATLLEEFAVLSLPVRKVHQSGQCNKEALNLLEELNNQGSDKMDPRWEKLKGLSNNPDF